MRLDDLIDSYSSDLPRYLKLIGPRPTNDVAQVHWRDAAHQIETYRAMHDITDPDRPLGPPARNERDRSDAQQIARHVSLIHQHEPRPRREHQHEHAIEADVGLEL